jgi:hypothetical protein
VFCERCGQAFLANESVCARCHSAPTRQWLQLVGLASLAMAFLSNAALSFLPHPGPHPRSRVLSAWLRLNDEVFLYGWIIAAVALLVWSFWIRRGGSVKIREWWARSLMILLLTAGIVSLRHRPLPGTIATLARAAIQDHPGLGSLLAWGMIVLVLGPLCMNSEIRDSLLGQGRILSLVALGMLLAVLSMALVGWSLPY